MHRDLKPENILFRKQNDCECVIADLGLGTKSDLKEYLFVRCGTPGFVAPEVVNIKDMKTTYDVVCDIYSLGLIFHILLMGKSPFNGKTYNEVLAQNRAGNVKLDGPEYLRITTDTHDLLKKMLEKDPKKRISSQQALLHPYFTKVVNKQPSKVPQEQQKEADKEFDDLDDEICEDDKDGQINKTMNQFNSNQVKFDMAKLNKQKSPVMPSPQLLPRNLDRSTLEADSCVSFKMNTPIFSGKVENQGGDESSSPGGSVLLLNTPLLKVSKFGMSPDKQIKGPLQLSLIHI
eukprot:TRINITY_DN358_c0_g1_i5.p1 TRINITY_DN358_c0_g1~~TRINITY_DN358_c0_g1_i5.p1  ORF type:complete len:290 (-),score=47.62 TRINITY_DN358_c0_g1_i5:185-1054(-)